MRRERGRDNQIEMCEGRDGLLGLERWTLLYLPSAADSEWGSRRPGVITLGSWLIVYNEQGASRFCARCWHISHGAAFFYFFLSPCVWACLVIKVLIWVDVMHATGYTWLGWETCRRAQRTSRWILMSRLLVVLFLSIRAVYAHKKTFIKLLKAFWKALTRDNIEYLWSNHKTKTRPGQHSCIEFYDHKIKMIFERVNKWVGVAVGMSMEVCGMSHFIKQSTNLFRK